jgi:4-methylaminobutanoate oxidase (formaldehyde-forming)
LGSKIVLCWRTWLRTLFQKDKGKEIYDLIVNIGKDFGLTHCGAHTMDTMRMESGFLHWGHDISPEENQYQAGLNFAISYKKLFYFIGKEKLLKIKDQKLDRRFVMLVLKESKPGEPLLLHEEPIYLDDKIIGKTTSGNYSFNYNKNLSFGYINCDFSNEQLVNKNLYIEIEKNKYPAELLAKPLKTNSFKNI